jgi:alcohol dehydrogenase/propanol-preferring alcohol dehydrogenase
MVFRTLTVQGTLMGSPQDLWDVIAMANDGRLVPTPVTKAIQCDAGHARPRTRKYQRPSGADE